MALNTWWNDDPNQRYWMQITDRPDLDGPLLAPKLPRQTWGYDLVSQVQPGDRVLHWRADAQLRGLVGWSEVEGYATVIPEYTWSPHAGGGGERTTLGWNSVLGQFHAFPSPVTSAQLLPILDQIVAVDDLLTPNEVDHGTTFAPIDLIVVDNVIPVRDPETGVVTHAIGGRRRVWVDWTPHESGLKAIAYAYTLPDHPTSIIHA